MKNVRKTLLLGLLLIVSIFFIIALRPYFTAVLTAVILFILFDPLYETMLKKIFKKKKKLCKLTTLIIIFLIIIIPLLILSSFVIKEAAQLTSSLTIDKLYTLTQGVFEQEQSLEILYNYSTNIFNYIKDSFASIIGSFVNFFVSIIIIFFMLYFMLGKSKDFIKTAKEYLPLKKKNIMQLINEGSRISKSTVIGTGLIAIIQGTLLSIGFFIFGIGNPIIWGLVATIASFLPVIGAALIYIPASIFLILNNDFIGGLGILLWGFFLVSLSDNILRPFIGNGIAKIHPLITLFGVIAGIKYFSIIGVVIGPLLLSYLILLLKMLKKEYL